MALEARKGRDERKHEWHPGSRVWEMENKSIVISYRKPEGIKITGGMNAFQTRLIYLDGYRAADTELFTVGEISQRSVD